MPIVEEADAATELPRALDDISRQLVTARTGAKALAHFPGVIPTDLASAYRVQSASIARWPDDIAGWKVGMLPAEFREPLAAERLCGPIFADSVFSIEPGGTRSMPIYRGGFAAVEAEFVFKVANTILPVTRSYSDEQLIDIVSSLHVGAEIASSPMADVNRLGPCCVVCDFGNNAGLVVGPSIPDWHSRPTESLGVSVSVDSEVVGSASAAAIDGGLLQALRFLIELSARRGLSLPEGTYVSCGAVTGIHDVTVDSKSLVDFGELGRFHVNFEPIQPMQEHAASVSS